MLTRLLNALWEAIWRASPSAAAEAVIDRARCLRTQGQLEAACQVLEAGIQRFPDEPQLLNNLGMLQLAGGDFSAAEQNFRRALGMCPSLAEAHSNLGIALCEQGCFADGLQAFQRAVEADPRLLAAHENIAALLNRENDHYAALDAWDRVLRLQPRHADAHASKGMLLMRQGLIDEAKEQLEHARRLALESSLLRQLEALIEAAIGDVAAARSILEMLRLREPNAEIDWQLALLHLSQGNFMDGWPLYEARLRREVESPRRAYSFPGWDGGLLDGWTLLIVAEQGLGDEIMFSSCYGDAMARVSRCVIECDPRLASLFTRSFAQAEIVGHVRGSNHDWLLRYPDIAYQIHAGSLPRLFRSTSNHFPRHDGYLRADRARVAEWKARLSTLGPAPKIGIAWRGGLQHTRRSLRSIPLADFAQILRSGNAHFISLQYDDDGGEALKLSDLAGTPVHHFGDVMPDIDESAALITALDMVITVCSSVVHLSGALGAPTWVLTPRVAEWRYLDHGEGMPWYPSVRLFRQTQLGNWQPLIEEVRDHLQEVLSSSS